MIDKGFTTSDLHYFTRVIPLTLLQNTSSARPVMEYHSHLGPLHKSPVTGLALLADD